MEITPEIRDAWDQYWATGFSELGLMGMLAACDKNGQKMIEAMKALSGSSDTVGSNQSYVGHRTRVPLGFQLK